MANSAPGGELIITTHGRDYGVPDREGTAVFLGSDNFLSNTLATIRTYIETHGTLENLTIVGHGETNSISTEEIYDPERGQELNTHALLAGIAEIQKETGIKVANRIVFNACDVMTNLSTSDVASYRKSAQMLGAEIVGGTSVGDYIKGAQVQPTMELLVAFGPDGSVHRDVLSATPESAAFFDDKTTYDQIAKNEKLDSFQKNILLPAIATVNHLVNPSTKTWDDLRSDEAKDGKDAWFACHDGKTQEEGAACQANLLPKERPDSRNVNAIKSTDAAPLENLKTDVPKQKIIAPGAHL
jgi:hypothetical protein